MKRAILISALLAAMASNSVVLGQPQGPPLCTMKSKGKYSIGALERFDGQIYQCVAAFGDELKPVGAAWVRMSDIHCPK